MRIQQKSTEGLGRTSPRLAVRLPWLAAIVGVAILAAAALNSRGEALERGNAQASEAAPPSAHPAPKQRPPATEPAAVVTDPEPEPPSPNDWGQRLANLGSAGTSAPELMALVPRPDRAFAKPKDVELEALMTGHAAAIERRWQGARADPQNTRATRTYLASVLADLDLDIAVSDVDCRVKVCRLELSLDDYAQGMSLMDLAARPGEHIVIARQPTSQEPTAIVFLTPEGLSPDDAEQ